MSQRLAVAAALLAAFLATAIPAEARARHRSTAASDVDRTLTQWAERDDHRGWRVSKENRPLSSYLPPLTRERIPAPPLTGWGYGGTEPVPWFHRPEPDVRLCSVHRSANETACPPQRPIDAL